MSRPAAAASGASSIETGPSNGPPAVGPVGAVAPVAAVGPVAVGPVGSTVVPPVTEVDRRRAGAGEREGEEEAGKDAGGPSHAPFVCRFAGNGQHGRCRPGGVESVSRWSGAVGHEGDAMPPRSMWKGAISFGLVTIPVAVYPATEEKSLRFNQLHDKDMGRIRYKRVCSIDEEEVELRAHRQGVRAREGPVRR